MNDRDMIAGRSETEAEVGNARVRVWLAYREALERQLEPLGQAAIARLSPRPGERVLDIGFGIGSTPFAIAQAVAPHGEVVGIDRLRAALDVMLDDPRSSSCIRLLHGDAENHSFPSGGFDAAFSRFGVMFFSDPAAAFANVRSALRPGGRLAFVCWQDLSENELDAVPIRAAAPHLPAQLVAEAETATHFSFSNPDYVRQVLVGAGYEAIDIREHSEHVGSGSLQAMVDVLSHVGSLGVILRDHPEYRSGAVTALEKALLPLDGPEGPMLLAATLIVSANVPR